MSLREVQASDAKAQLAQLLDEVERGETVVITRHGRPIARLTPEGESRRYEISLAIENIRSVQRRTAKVTGTELTAARHEGHKY